jgi:ribosomal-protein-serine acetyltransferase
VIRRRAHGGEALNGEDLAIKVDDDTELLLLREEDAEAVYAEVDSNREHLRRFLPFVDPSQSPADTLDFIRQSREGWAKGDVVQTGVWYMGEVAGCLGTASINRQHDEAEIGYWLAERFQGRGLMTRSCHALIGYLFKEREFHRIVIRTDVENTRSRALAERLGFTFEGIQREACKLRGDYHDLMHYSLLSPEWQPER